MASPAETFPGHLLTRGAGSHGDSPYVQEGQGEFGCFFRAVRFEHEDDGMLRLVHPICQDFNAVLVRVGLGDMAGQLAHHVRILSTLIHKYDNVLLLDLSPCR